MDVCIPGALRRGRAPGIDKKYFGKFVLPLYKKFFSVIIYPLQFFRLETVAGQAARLRV